MKNVRSSIAIIVATRLWSSSWKFSQMLSQKTSLLASLAEQLHVSELEHTTNTVMSTQDVAKSYMQLVAWLSRFMWLSYYQFNATPASNANIEVFVIQVSWWTPLYCYKFSFHNWRLSAILIIQEVVIKKGKLSMHNMTVSIMNGESSSTYVV